MRDPAVWLIVLDWGIRLVFSVRVIMRRGPTGASLAWLTIILLLPLLGAVLYLVFSEARLGYRRAVAIRRKHAGFREWRQRLSTHQYQGWSHASSDPAQLARLISNAAAIPALEGNHLDLLDSAEQVFETMIDDIRSARHSCHLEFYIWEVGGKADQLADAVAAAAGRGVDCRILVDAVGSRGFLRSGQRKQLESSGVQIRAALPASLFRSFFFRFDLRLHRKISVIDQSIAYAGSQNMADPKLFQKGAGFGQWIDAMVRVQGPAVDALSMTFWEDWNLDSPTAPADHELPDPEAKSTPCGPSPVQVVPSGPGTYREPVRQALLNAIYMADQRLFITSPYFVPDETLQTSLISAAQRGVDVTIIVPQKVNSLLVRLASRPLLRELVQAGVRVAGYHAGMLHTKSVVIDDDIAMFGSLNLDPRSLHLNFEIMLVIYEHQFTLALSDLQERYLCDSRIYTADEFRSESFVVRLLENCARLLSPLL